MEQLSPQLWSIIVIVTIGLFLVALRFSILYRKILSHAQKEYEGAKDVVTGIILTYRKRQEEQAERVENLTNSIEATRGSIERFSDQLERHEDRLDSFVTSIKTALLADKKLAENVLDLRKRTDTLAANQQDLRKKVETLEEKYKGMLPEVERAKPITVEEGSSTSKLTETEQQIIQYLMTEGPKTAPEIEQKIVKTREHTSRLMKKLFLDGFVERDTHKIPYAYRVNERLRKSVEAQT